ncbi:MAG TPA: hypothetical protein VFK89_04470 [Actinomycetota bacterium]|nr:hypothetical protein [Actinomycetota bacterium]
MRKKRADGRAASEIPAYRRMMPYLMRSRSESVVFFEQEIDMTAASSFIAAFNRKQEVPITPFHVVMWGCVQTLAAFPKLNRFIAGGRIYDRDGIWISYSAKKAMTESAPIVVVKRRFDPAETFAAMVAGMQEELTRSRAPEESYTDKELGLVLKAQGLPLRALMALERAADAFGLLPRSYIERDPMFASLFVANLGSLKMDAAFHHLYEYGSISIFCVVGRMRERDGGPSLTLRFTYDERIEDGFYANRALTHMKELLEELPLGRVGA